MTFISRLGMFAVTVAVASAPLISDPSAIGRASAESGLVVDSGRASGNALVFEGSTIQTATRSQIRLADGTHLNLSAGSKAQVFAGRLALNTGVGEVQSGSGFEIDARTLSIRPVDSRSIARVDLSGKDVLVTAVNSTVDVKNQGGVLVARVFPDRPMTFLPQAGASGSSPSSFNSTACLLDAGDSVVLADSNHQIFELRGKTGTNFKRAVGKKTTVVGLIDTAATPKPGAVKAAGSGTARVVTVAGLKVDKDQTGAGCDSLAKAIGVSIAAGAGAAAAAGAATGASVAAAAGAATAAGIAIPTAAAVSTAVVVGGVAAGAAAVGVGTAAATGAIGSSSTGF